MLFGNREVYENTYNEVIKRVKAKNVAKLIALVKYFGEVDYTNLHETIELLKCNKRNANDYLCAVRFIMKTKPKKITTDVEELLRLKEEFFEWNEEIKKIRQKSLRNLCFLWKYDIEDWKLVMRLLGCSVSTAESYAQALEYLKKICY